jgi:hypothetical protein
MIERQDDCNFCTEGQMAVGEKSDYGAMTIFKTGDSLEKDWYSTLQPGTPTDPEVGVHCLAMPLGHIPYFSDINRNREFRDNYGKVVGVVSEAMQTLLQEEWTLRGESGIFVPNQIDYGKHAPGRNTIAGHLHTRLTDFSGDLAQHYPSDTGWRKREVFEDDGGPYVKANPVKSVRFSPERFDKISSRLIELADEADKRVA